jgi:hypothetical protein
MKIIWYEFRPEKFGCQKLPKERKRVLLQLSGNEKHGVAPAVVVGYLKYAAGDKQSPVFVHPGAGSTYSENGHYIGVRVTHWADCLGKEFAAPLWKDKAATIGVDNKEYPEILGFYCSICGDITSVEQAHVKDNGNVVCRACYNRF